MLKLNTLQTAIPAFWLAMIAVMCFAFMWPLFPYGGALTPGYKLHLNPAIFWGVWCGFIALAIILYIIFKKGILLYTIPLIGLYIACRFAIPFEDVADIAYHAFLPIVVVSLGSIVSYSLSVRNNMINVVNEDYILTARAKGLPEKVILYKHTFRNSLLPLVTNLGMNFVGLFGGSVLIEQIFSWPGMGRLMLEANTNGDFLLVQAILLFFAVLTIVANFITDIIYHKLDPRVSVQ